MGITSVFQTDEEVSSTSFRSSFLQKIDIWIHGEREITTLF